MPTLSPTLLIGGVECCLSLGEDGAAPDFGESWGPSGPEADAVFSCAWADRYALARALMGSVTLVGGVVARTPPFTWYESPNLHCTSLGTIRGQGRARILQAAEGLAPAGWIAWERALVPAHFTVPRWDTGVSSEPPRDPSGLPYTSTRFQVSGEVFTPPNGTFYYQDGGPAWVAVHDSLLGIPRPKVEISMTRHWLPWNFDLDTIMALIGGVNDDIVTFGNRDFPRGTILFGGFGATETVDAAGSRSYDVECGLLANYDTEWNELMGQDGDWHILNSRDDGSGKPPFKYVNLLAIP